MTGFGLSSFIDKKSEIYIEIKGVNHKFLEATIKPNDLNNELEKFIRNLVSKKIVRGRVDIRIKTKTTSNTNYSIDSKLLKKFKKSLVEGLKFKGDIHFRDIKDVPGIFKLEAAKDVNNNVIPYKRVPDGFDFNNRQHIRDFRQEFLVKFQVLCLHL